MDAVYSLQGVDFEWDEDKARRNLRDHHMTFEEAVEVFFDPFYQTGEASVDEKPREFIIGYTFSQHLLFVVYTAARVSPAHHFSADGDARGKKTL